MNRQLIDAHYVHSALFKDLETAKATLREVDAAGLSTDKLALSVIGGTMTEVTDVPLRRTSGDGRKGLLLGLLMGAFAGLLLSAVVARLLLPPELLEPAALFGLLGGMFLGGLGGGTYGLRPWRDPPLDESSPHPASCLIIAKTFDQATILRVEDIFKKHRLVPAMK